jgi:uncharacterized protein affecting Mg2+/Co2+ transport
MAAICVAPGVSNAYYFLARYWQVNNAQLRQRLVLIDNAVGESNLLHPN